MIITYRYRVKDKHAAELNRQARAVNFVWNYCNETQQKAVRDGRKWLSAYDLEKLTAGACVLLNIHSETIKRVCGAYFIARRKHNKAWLKWRGRKALGWVPFKVNIKFQSGRFIFRGVEYFACIDRPIPANSSIRDGSFSQDSRGRWYINCSVEIAAASFGRLSHVGVDLGLKDLLTLSTGEAIRAPQFYRASEAMLATAQRLGKTRRAKAISARIANRRRDFLHKVTTKIAVQFGLIVIGDVSSADLSRTKMAKSVLDAGWSDLRRMLSYKAIMHGGSALEVSERMSSQTCSECGALPPSRPRGIVGLSKRVWACDDCGAVHTRDVNAARNILRIGLDALSGGAPHLGSSHEREGVAASSFVVTA